ncbi:MAG TPA: iron chelate uptake ABC transporter family permease subunit [Candidatus Corynebacterium gallistercoris]|uniref:Iron chelate uptake ABC transporter family permease subunit n=1 Tax=Candidatus Corynebacterium gallistercoris TaxID=2838530 RepID=A0A9D1UQT9_9CORY|nr:iron chelate uptake ABC transporter family permease subunit [Candidatus Corynebacterium gallistercoris]
MTIQQTSIPGRPAFRVGAISAVWRPWVLGVTLLLTLCVVLLTAFSIGLGDYPLSAWEVLRILVTGEGSRLERVVVLEWRLPRALTAVAVGCALGLSGALMQSVTRNPLASPDILGITTGASAAAVTVITVSGTGSALSAVAGWMAGVGVPVVALLGGFLTGAVIWVLAWRRSVDPFRLVLFGIIITALLQSYIHFLMVRAELKDAAAAQFWLAGSLNASNWERTLPISVIVVACAPLAGWMTYKLSASLLGPDVAMALGQKVTVAQFAFLSTAVALAAVAVAAAGPIGFIAFVAPQLAVRLCRLSSPPLIASAVMGALLLVGADTIVQSALPVELPVGLITSAIGGLFLIYLLVNKNRKAAI